MEIREALIFVTSSMLIDYVNLVLGNLNVINIGVVTVMAIGNMRSFDIDLGISAGLGPSAEWLSTAAPEVGCDRCR